MICFFKCILLRKCIIIRHPDPVCIGSCRRDLKTGVEASASAPVFRDGDEDLFDLSLIIPDDGILWMGLTVFEAVMISVVRFVIRLSTTIYFLKMR